MRISLFLGKPLSHWYAAVEPVWETLKQRGHDLRVTEYGQKVPIDTEVLILVSDHFRPERPKGTKSAFVPHGVGDEIWHPRMSFDDKVFLPGLIPWTPPEGVDNWEIVGYPKADELLKPKKTKIRYAEKLMGNLPYKETILCIQVGGEFGVHLPEMKYLINFLTKKEMNIIIPWREAEPQALRIFKYKNIVSPKILNLFYFTKYAKMVVSMTDSSLAREFYLAKIPVLHLGKQGEYSSPWIRCFPESLVAERPERFETLFDQIREKPQEYLQPETIVKKIFAINDGHATERIVRRIEEFEK